MQATVDISKAQSITGWMSDSELLWLASRASECTTIVEFGSYHGRSSRVLADHCHDGRVWCVDPWNGEYPGINGESITSINTFVLPQFCRNLDDHIKSGRVVPHRGFSSSFRLPYEVDMVFIDGDHRYEPVKKDIDQALKLLKPGGLLSGHDWGWPSVKQAVLEKLHDVNVEEGTSIWWKRK